MRTVQNIETVRISVKADELIGGKWLHYQLLSKKIAGKEKDGNMGYKSLRNKLYNNTASGKFNLKEVAGLKCIDVTSPMVPGAVSSLVIEFTKEE